jgi:hypothetical protein
MPLPETISFEPVLFYKHSIVTCQRCHLPMRIPERSMRWRTELQSFECWDCLRREMEEELRKWLGTPRCSTPADR